MEDAGLPAPQNPPAPQTLQVQQASQPPGQPVQLTEHLDQLVQTQPIQHMLQLNWSQFKPEFSGKPEEDAEAHLLRLLRLVRLTKSV